MNYFSQQWFTCNHGKNKVGNIGNCQVLSEQIQVCGHPSILVGEIKRAKWTTVKCYPKRYKSVGIAPSSETWFLLFIHSTMKNMPNLKIIFYWLWRQMISIGGCKTKFTALLNPIQNTIKKREGIITCLLQETNITFFCLIKFLYEIWNWNW